MKTRIVLLTTIAICCLWAFSYAGDVRLAWDASPTPGVTKQFVYYGKAPRTYSQKIEIGKELEYTVKNLQDATWYFAVTAGDDEGNESGFSNEVSLTIITYEPPGNVKGDHVGPNIVVINTNGSGNVTINAFNKNPPTEKTPN